MTNIAKHGCKNYNKNNVCQSFCITQAVIHVQSYEPIVPEQISEVFTLLSTHHSYQTRSIVNGNLYMPTNHLFTEQDLSAMLVQSFGMKFHLKSEILIH